MADNSFLYGHTPAEAWDKLKSGLQQYCRSQGFQSVILGLSGGIDSALTAVLAADALGGENVTAIMMRTKYTSPLSLAIAREIAGLNRLHYKELDIQNLIDTEISFLQQAFGKAPAGIVIENLQARARGKILMAWSNQFGGLVLACGNKSEAATGYCTLYGDTCGGIMPIGSIYKTGVFTLAKWRNSLNRVLPSEVIVRAPSAELALNQKDENTLPPYYVLDSVLCWYLDEGKKIAEVIDLGIKNKIFGNAAEAEKITDWIIRRYNAAEFKRRQMPPAVII